ncbi:SRPBCC family protein [Actinomadura rugatobispora]|uniref:SRPBCC family protein n=1 Tax=Actinomadura rugatobispora TaxID=1994 RepID=A0ABW0ZS00_9ACTN|nr:SRPBCC domain-containing protein [Actinomadura rugatobispora]
MPVRTLAAIIALLVAVPAGLYTWTRLKPREIRTEIEIDAAPGPVWRVLTDLRAYPDWNPFIISAEGEVREGGRLTNKLTQKGGGTLTFSPTILVAAPDRELRWLGRLIVPGVLDGEHYFRLEALDGGRTRLVHGERFTGALVPFAGGPLDVADGFRAMNAALKSRAETMAR